MKLYLVSVLCLGVIAISGCKSFEGHYVDQGGTIDEQAAGDGTGDGSESVSPDQGSAGEPALARREPERHSPRDIRDQIEAARSLPLPEGNYMVQVERIWFAESESSAIGALLGFQNQNINVQAGGQSADAGFRIGVAKGGFFGALDGHMRNSRGTSREQIMLTMVADFPASLAIGQTRFVIPFTVGGVRFGQLVPEGQFVGTSLEAMCSDRGAGRVQVQLTPVFNGLGPGGETVRVAEATTTVLLSKGQPLLIASQDSTRENVATSLLSRRTERGNEQAVLVVTVK